MDESDQVEFMESWTKMMKAMADRALELMKQPDAGYHLAIQIGVMARSCFMVVEHGPPSVIAAFQASEDILLKAVELEQDLVDVMQVDEGDEGEGGDTGGVTTYEVIAGGALGRTLSDGGE